MRYVSLTWTKRLLAIALVIIAVALGGAIYLFNSTAGSRWLLTRITDIIPGTLRTEELKGTLWRGLEIRQLEWRSPEQAITANNLRLVVRWPDIIGGRLNLHRISIDHLAYVQQTEETKAPQPLTINFHPLPLITHIDHARIGSLTVAVPGTETQLQKIEVKKATLAGFRLHVVHASLGYSDITLVVNALATRLRGDIPLRTKFDWRHHKTGYAGTGKLRGSLAELLLTHQLEGPYAAAISGRIKLLERIDPIFQINIDWQQWQFSSYSIKQGKIGLKGSPNDYDVSFTGQLISPLPETVTVEATATGHGRGLADLSLQAAAAQGQLRARGALTWTPQFNAALDINFDRIDPALFNRQLAGEIAGQFRLQFESIEQVEVPEFKLFGTLNHVTLNGTGALSRRPGEEQCSGCILSVGENRIRVDGGRTGEQLALQIALDAPKLAQVLPVLGGRLAGDGMIRGSVENPVFNGQIQGDALRYAQWRATHLSILSKASNRQYVDIEASASGLARDELALGSTTLRVRGSHQQLSAQIEWALGQLRFNANSRLERDAGSWFGHIDNGRFFEPNTGTWRLRTPVTLRYNADTAEIGAHDWSSDSGLVQISRARLGADLELVAALTDLPLALANPALPAGMRLLGRANAEINLTQREDIWEGFIKWRQHGTALQIAQTYTGTASVMIPRFEAEVNLLNSGGASVALSTNIDNGLSANLQAEVDRLDRLAHINGNIKLTGAQWSWVPALLPDLDEVKGTVTADLSISGPLTEPNLDGELLWRDGHLMLPALNIALQDIDLTVSGKPAARMEVLAKARSGDGHLALAGSVEELMHSNRTVTLKLTGQKAEFINWPEYRAWMSPQLEVNGDANGWRIGGELVVPRAEITVRELPEGAVKPSPDIRVLGAPKPETKTANYAARVHVALGKEVHIQALGLDTHVAGRLLVTSSDSPTLSAQGQLALVDGVFKRFGQKLTIRKGTLTFAGPIDNPLIDIEAVREIDNLGRTILAGIHIRGYQDDLTTSVFSEPAMSEADALSYLLTGRPLTGLSASQGGDLSNAAIALGVTQAARISQDIAQRFGLDQLTVTGGGEETALMAGKDFSPRLYARYAYGIFSQVGTLFLGYRLTEHLRVEAGAGEKQTIDLLYTIEKP